MNLIHIQLCAVVLLFNFYSGMEIGHDQFATFDLPKFKIDDLNRLSL